MASSFTCKSNAPLQVEEALLCDACSLYAALPVHNLALLFKLIVAGASHDQASDTVPRPMADAGEGRGPRQNLCHRVLG